jgi:hypothetical protein
VNEDGAAVWDYWRALDPWMAAAGACAETLCAVREYLAAAQPEGMTILGLAIVENEMINRFMNETRNGGGK